MYDNATVDCILVWNLTVTVNMQARPIDSLERFRVGRNDAPVDLRGIPLRASGRDQRM